MDQRIVEQVERLTIEIADRLRPVCAHLTEAELFALASGMALIETKYIALGSTTGVDRDYPAAVRPTKEMIVERALATVRARQRPETDPSEGS